MRRDRLTFGMIIGVPIVQLFLFGFAKSEQENIDPDELLTLRDITASWLAADAALLADALANNFLQEVEDGEDE